MFENLIILISFAFINCEFNSGNKAKTETTSADEGYLQTWLSSVYRCDKDSYFRRVNRTAQGLTDFKCNDLAMDTHKYTAIGYTADNDEVELKINQAYYALRDINGNEDYNNFGTISSGKCKGGLVLIKDLSFVAKGSCDSGNGVTQVQSGPRDALFTIDGICKSTCSGKVTVDYRPGKRNTK